MAATNDPAQLSPKVKWGTISGLAAALALTVIVAFLQNITPEMLEALGVWAGPVGAAIGALATGLAAYRVLDPLRQDYGAQKAAHENVGAEDVPAQAVAADLVITDQDGYQGKHVADPIVYDPPTNLKG